MKGAAFAVQGVAGVASVGVAVLFAEVLLMQLAKDGRGRSDATGNGNGQLGIGVIGPGSGRGYAVGREDVALGDDTFEFVDVRAIDYREEVEMAGSHAFEGEV